jgi:hypothetical protein
MATTRETIAAAYDREHSQHEAAAAMLAILKANNGKKLSKRLCPALSEAAGEPVIISRSFGLISLQTESYWRTDGNQGLRLFIASGMETLPTIDAADIEERNGCYYAAALKRQESRQELLGSDIPEAIDAAAEELAAAREAYRGLAGPQALTDWPAVAKVHGVDVRSNWF